MKADVALPATCRSWNEVLELSPSILLILGSGTARSLLLLFDSELLPVGPWHLSNWKGLEI